MVMVTASCGHEFSRGTSVKGGRGRDGLYLIVLCLLGGWVVETVPNCFLCRSAFAILALVPLVDREDLVLAWRRRRGMCAPAFRV